MQREKIVNDEFAELMEKLSTPRLNGSHAVHDTRLYLTDWLKSNAISSHLHTYRLFPYFMEIGGLWLVFSQILLALSIWLRWGWIAMPIALIGLTVMILETKGVHILSRLVAQDGENVIVELMPTGEVQQEVILSAHYDSKTELFYDRLRNFFMGKLPIAMATALVLGLLGIADAFVSRDTLLSSILHYAGIGLTVVQLSLFLPLGVNFIFGRFASPSQGAVDNGAACAILLGVAKRFAEQKISLAHTKVTIAIFSGEEVVVQGSRAYVRDREFPYPTTALNLELMGQGGNYFVWETIGDPFSAYPTTAELNLSLEAIIDELTESRLLKASGPAGTDSLPFLAAGISATSLASVDVSLGTSGLHTPSDSLKRVYREKLQESLLIIFKLLEEYDSKC